MVPVRKILFVGSGLTSAIAASQLRILNESLEIVIWEKARGAGGRMSTSRSPAMPSCQADLGAQYITISNQITKEHNKIFEELRANNLLKPLEGIIEGLKPINNYNTSANYVAPLGSSSIVKHFLNKTSRLTIRYNYFLESLKQKDKYWEAKTSEGEFDLFDAVILTVPVPQIFQIDGDTRTIIENQSQLSKQLKCVTYSSRYVLALFYDSPLEVVNKLPWVAKYFPDNPIVRFISIDNIKRGGHVESPSSIVVHSTINFGKENLEIDKKEIEAKLLIETLKLLPKNLPKADFLKCHRWRYSQVIDPFEDQPGVVVLHKLPLLLCAGDGFYQSGFLGCLHSAFAVTRQIHTFL